jgi:hypothetical protein
LASTTSRKETGVGIDVARLVRECEQCLQELEELGRERVREFDRTKTPNVEWA